MSESDSKSASSHDEANASREAEEISNYLDLSYYVNHAGSSGASNTSALELPLSSAKAEKPAVEARPAAQDENDDGRFHDAELEDDDAVVATTAEAEIGWSSSEGRLSMPDSPQPKAKTTMKTLRKPLFQLGGDFTPSQRSGRVLGKSARPSWTPRAGSAEETIKSKAPATRTRMPLPNQFLNADAENLASRPSSYAPTESSSTASVSTESPTPSRVGPAVAPPGQDSSHILRRQRDASKARSTSTGSASPASVQQHPPSVPLLDDPVRSNKRRSIRLVGTNKTPSFGQSKFSSDASSSMSALAGIAQQLQQAAPGVVPSPMTMRGGTGGHPTPTPNRVQTGAGQVNLMSTVVGPLSPPASEEMANKRALDNEAGEEKRETDSRMDMRTATSTTSSMFDSEIAGPESRWDQEGAAAGAGGEAPGTEDLDVLLDLEDLKLADKEIPAEKLVSGHRILPTLAAAAHYLGREQVRETKIGSGSFKCVDGPHCWSPRNY